MQPHANELVTDHAESSSSRVPATTVLVKTASSPKPKQKEEGLVLSSSEDLEVQKEVKEEKAG